MFDLSGNVYWELDFWGKYRRATEAAKAELLASEIAAETCECEGKDRDDEKTPEGRGHVHFSENVLQNFMIVAAPGQAGLRRCPDSFSGFQIPRLATPTH